jgi:hypothetical protein
LSAAAQAELGISTLTSPEAAWRENEAGARYAADFGDTFMYPWRLEISASYHFQNVGQGLFASGWLVPSPYPRPTPPPRIRWVYDCGSLSSNALIAKGLTELLNHFDGRERLDLVAISHFDRDHISGICDLLKAFPVDILLLPYVSPSKRLLIALAEGISPNDPIMGFFIDPIEYLRGIDGVEVTRFVFVMPGGEDGVPVPTPELPRRPQGENVDAAQTDRLVLVRERDEAPEQFGNNEGVRFLESGGAIEFRDLWEFVPYNDDEADIRNARNTQRFLGNVAKYRADLLNSASAKARKNVMRLLKQLYDKTFGTGSIHRNAISLFLYSGPIGLEKSSAPATDGAWFHLTGSRQRFHLRYTSPPAPSGGVLYSGDAYVASPKQLKRMVTYLNDERIRRLAVFQVMHHGSEHNWHRGVAARLAPRFSVFSSDPERKKWLHPHAPVVRDFLPYSPVQVDKERSVTFHCEFWMPSK